MEIRNAPSCYDKNELPSLKSTQLVFFGEVQVKPVSIPPTISWLNDYNFFPRDEKGKVDVERGVYETKNQLNKATFKYEQEGRFFS